MFHYIKFMKRSGFWVFVFLGRQLKLEGDNFRQKLNTQHIFDDWVQRVQAKNISLAGRVFTIEKRQKDGKIALNLKVNFSNDVVTLFKEVELERFQRNSFICTVLSTSSYIVTECEIWVCREHACDQHDLWLTMRKANRSHYVLSWP